MGQRVIPVAVTAEYIGGDGVTLGAAGSHNSVVIEYDFRSAGPQWDDISGRYVLWTNPQGNSTNRINLGVSEKVEGYEGVYQAAPPADAMCVPGWAEMVVVGFTMDGDKEVTKIKTEPSRFRVLPGSSRAADNEGVAPTVADQLQAEIEAVNDALTNKISSEADKKVNKPVAPNDPDGREGQVLKSLGGGLTVWDDPEVADEDTVEAVLKKHPEWTTTVQNGAVTTNKLAGGAVTGEKIADKSVGKSHMDQEMALDFRAAEMVSNIDFRNAAYMSLAYPGYSSAEGMCVIENRYIVVARYMSGGAKDLMVFDPITRKVVTSNVFQKTDGTPDEGQNVDLDHCNDMTYYDGYIYLPRYENHHDIIRLYVDSGLNISFDSVVWERPIESAIDISGVACHNGVFYLEYAGGSGGKFHVYKTADFEDIELAFSSDFGGMVYTPEWQFTGLAKQGMAFDGEFLYFGFSGRNIIEPTSSATTADKYQYLNHNIERIVVTTTDGEILRVFTFPRGKYGEMESLDVVEQDGRKYLLVCCNQDTTTTSHVYSAPFFGRDAPSNVFDSKFIGAVSGSGTTASNPVIYCDNSEAMDDIMKSNPFSFGVFKEPFTDYRAAVSCILRAGVPCTLVLRGQYDDINLSGLPAGTRISISGASIHSITVYRCSGVTITGTGENTIEQIICEESVVLLSPGLKFVKSGSLSVNAAIAAYRSAVYGAVSQITGEYSYVSRLLQGTLVLHVSTLDQALADPSKATYGIGGLVSITSGTQNPRVIGA